MLADKEIVHSLIPQAPPMIMVDRLLFQDNQKSVTGFSIEEDNIFCMEGMFSEEGMIENMAQSVALRSGWKAMDAGERETFKPAIGVLGAIKSFKLFNKPLCNKEINTEIEIIAEVFNASVVKGMVKQDGALMAEAELKIFIPDK